MSRNINLDDVIQKITEEQERLNNKKQQVQNLIERLSKSLDNLDQKSYRGLSHLTGEVIKSLVSAHDLDIKISNTLLKSYEQLARLLKEVESKEEISFDLLQMIEKHLMSDPSILEDKDVKTQS